MGVGADPKKVLSLQTIIEQTRLVNGGNESLGVKKAVKKVFFTANYLEKLKHTPIFCHHTPI
jgi:hypothetical protein